MERRLENYHIKAINFSARNSVLMVATGRTANKCAGQLSVELNHFTISIKGGKKKVPKLFSNTWPRSDGETENLIN